MKNIILFQGLDSSTTFALAVYYYISSGQGVVEQVEPRLLATAALSAYASSCHPVCVILGLRERREKREKKGDERRERRKGRREKREKREKRDVTGRTRVS